MREPEIFDSWTSGGMLGGHPAALHAPVSLDPAAKALGGLGVAKRTTSSTTPLSVASMIADASAIIEWRSPLWPDGSRNFIKPSEKRRQTLDSIGKV